MSFVDSSSIKVFPSTRRVSEQRSSRQLSESSIVGIINKLVDSDGFVITETLDMNKEFEFNIHGYYFKVEKAIYIQNLFSEDEKVLNIYANIKLDTSNDYTELMGQDDGSYYQGVNFAPDPDTSANAYSLLLFSRDSATSGWYVPNDSRVKFTSETLDLIIDGGEI